MVPIAAFEFFLGLAVAVPVIRRGHGLFLLRSYKHQAPRLGDQGRRGGSSDEDAHLVSLIAYEIGMATRFLRSLPKSPIRLGRTPTVAMLDG